ncbi:lipid kinase, YegS/Rv2252/BmrU family [Microlunatus soli]|uniref:Lipid kinase, YegS/Rv2252/BmrU family n=1 Tax=Microlunatus soli TaxID=630515 RepID=A0A1H1Y1H0_9ACTN|nr:lipid kinase, YegS/Rv2252/BmrU family [Microlunatus soli]
MVNTRSRTGERDFRTARQLLLDRGLPLTSTFGIDDPARIPEVVQELVRSGTDLVVLGGGDGTISAVVDHLADQLPVLGILPLGTANDFARTLGIPTTVAAACEVIAQHHVVDVDLGVMGTNYFANVASVGLSVTTTEVLTDRLKRRAGRLAYPIAVLGAVRRQRPFSAMFTFPDGSRDPIELDQLVQIAVGNGRHYGGGNVVAPDAGLDDHALDVYAIRAERRRDLTAVLRSFRSGAFVHRDNVTHLVTRSVTVTTEPPLPVNVDGELVARTPQEFHVARNALRVLVPVDSTAARLDAGQDPPMPRIR